MLFKNPFWIYFCCVAQFCNRVTQALYLDFWTLVIFEPLRIQQRTGESPRARGVPGFCLTKFHAVVAKTEASRCCSGRLQWTAKIINCMRLIWGRQCLPLSCPGGCGRAGSSRILGDAVEGQDWGMKGSEAPQGDFCFRAFSSVSRCFPPLQSWLCPLGFVCRSLSCRGPGSRGCPRCWCIHGGRVCPSPVWAGTRAAV